MVRNYPATEAAYMDRKALLRGNFERSRAAGKMTRRGIPNGFKGRREEVEQLRFEAEEQACRLARVICRNSEGPEEQLDPDTAPARSLAAAAALAITDAQRAELAMIGLLSFIVSETWPTSVRTKAARILLGFVKARPRGQRAGVVRLEDGLEFLRSLSLMKAG